MPELANVLDIYIHEPYTMPPMTQLEVGCIIGEDYPTPIVDHKAAKAKVWDLYKRDDVKAAAQQVVERHSSRKNRN